MLNEPTNRNAKTGASSDRSFALFFALAFLLVGIQPVLRGHNVRGWALALSAAFVVTAFTIPFILAPINRLWTRFGMLLHGIISPWALAILYLVAIMPVGLIMQLFRKDPLRLRLDKNATSYWIVRSPPGPDPESLKNQY